jgi:hypothetical protein
MKNRSLLALIACGTFTLNAQEPARTMEQVPGAMTSWGGQAGTKDHIETRALSQGSVLACEAVDAPGSALPPGCFVSLDNGSHYTVPAHNVIRVPKDGVATLTCNGPSPNWCRVQVTEDKSPLKRGDTKAHKQSDEPSKKLAGGTN